jgi:tyrosyl-tRNA synthetase
MVDNAEWLDELEYIPFLREIGQHFSINRMLSFDSVKLRLDREQSLSFLEFNYMILQAYDFLELSRRAGCRLQMGGSDQWGNIVNGVELPAAPTGREVFGLTTPLITNADGSKMGKTVGGAVWLNEEQLPAYDYWQFWRNTDDRDVGRFLRLFTDLPLEEIALPAGGARRQAPRNQRPSSPAAPRSILVGRKLGRKLWSRLVIGSRARPIAPMWSSQSAIAICPAIPIVMSEATPIFGAA